MLDGKLQILFPLRFKCFNEVKLPSSSGTYDKLQSAIFNSLKEINPCVEAGERLMESGFLTGDSQNEKSEYHDCDCDPSNPSNFSNFEQPERFKFWRDFKLQIPIGSFLRFLQFFKFKTRSLSRHSTDW